MSSLAQELNEPINGTEKRKLSEDGETVEMENLIDSSIFVDEGKGLIDMILAYHQSRNETKNRYREIFEEKLREEGLHLEYQGVAESQDGRTCYVKIHAPWDCLAKNAEINRVRVPIRRCDFEATKKFEKGLWMDEILAKLSELSEKGNPFILEKDQRPPETEAYFTTEFVQEKLSSYLFRDSDLFFTQIERIRVVCDVLQRTVIKDSDLDGLCLPHHTMETWVGLSYLLKHGVYNAVYPLHDGDIKVDTKDRRKKPKGLFPMRPWLYENWARFGRIYKVQPIDQVRKYFGEKVAFYFAWLGFYTAMLLPLSIIGVLCFLFGLLTCPFDTPMLEVCSKTGTNLSKEVICRLCPAKNCNYQKMSDYCFYAVITVIFNNSSTIVFALVTSLWAVLFLELWKRKEARLTCKWDTFDLPREYEPPRPEYQAAAKEKRRHPITNEWEPYISHRSRRQHIFQSVSGVAFVMCILLAIIIGIIFYKIIMVIVYHNLNNHYINTIGSSTFTTVTASTINIMCILILEYLYYSVAWKLTEWEYPRTMTDFEKSYTYKMYIFEFVNYYATLFYLAFIQGYIATTPDELTLMTDHCSPVGCTFSVTTQICIILTVKQIWNNVVEIWFPFVKHYWRMFSHKLTSPRNIHGFYSRYEKDFDLADQPELGLFQAYLEMVLQYGFVTLFGAAFPLAPLLAFCNNLFEIRIDALKFVRNSKRPKPEKATGIGSSWYGILVFITRLSILTNALLIAFTTDLIDRIVFLCLYSKNGKLDGFMSFAMSVFDTQDWPDKSLIYGGEKYGNVSTCLFKGYYNGPDRKNKYDLSDPWWQIMMAKVAFVLIFQNVIYWTQSLIQYIIPDVPNDVQLHLQRNYYVSKAEAQKHEDQKMHTKDFHDAKKKLGDLREEFFSKSAAPVMSAPGKPVPKPRSSRRQDYDTAMESQSRIPLLIEEESTTGDSGDPQV